MPNKHILSIKSATEPTRELQLVNQDDQHFVELAIMLCILPGENLVNLLLGLHNIDNRFQPWELQTPVDVGKCVWNSKSHPSVNRTGQVC